jgi:hypothetical protein
MSMRVERLCWNTPDDIIALTNAGAPPLPPVIPGDLATLAGTGIETAQGVMMKLRDEIGQVVGLGTELEVYPTDPDGLLEVWFTMMLPGRGTLFVHETKRYADPALMEVFAKVAATGEGWEGILDVVSTAGPGPDGLGVIVSGTGEFEGVSGTQSQTMGFRRVPADGFPVVETVETLTLHTD